MNGYTIHLSQSSVCRFRTTIAAKNALQEAAAKIADRMLPKLVTVEEK